MKIIKKGVKVLLREEGYNNMPGREKIQELLMHYLGQNGVSKYEVANLEGKSYWNNGEDTLVIIVNEDDTWRFGADRSMYFATNLACFVKESACDEFHIEKKGRETAMRFWWD